MTMIRQFEQLPPGNCSIDKSPVEDSTYKGPMITCTTNPLNADHDGDTLKDGDDTPRSNSNCKR